MSIVGRYSQNPRFSPDCLPGLSLWLDAADSTTLFQDTAGTSPVTSNGQTLRRWNDKSGRGCNATQAGNAPTWNSAGYTTFTRTSTQTLRLPDGTLPYSAVNTEYSMFAVVRPTVASAILTILCSGSAGTNLFNGLQINFARLSNLWYANDVGGGSVPLNVFSIASAIYTGSSRAVFLTGSNITTTNSTGWAGTISNNVIGLESATNNHPFGGDIAELIVYPTALSTAERQVVEGYLARKWGITELTGDPYRFGGPRILPTQISGCSLWLDGADPAGTGSPPSIGTSVSTWVDKSGNGRNAISEGTSIPTFSNRGITYNGSGFYRTSYSAALPAETLFVVFRWASIGTGGPAFIGGTQWFQRLLYVDPAESRWIYFGGIASWGRWNTSPLSSNVDYMLGVTWNSSSVILHLNGSSLATAGGVGTIASFSGSPTDSLIGGGGFNGTMYEMIGYNTVLTTAQRQLVEGYLASKWGLQASFPAPVAIGPYAGPIIPVRNFSPLDIDGLSLWLDAADATQFTFSSGSNISSVREKSGNTYTFTQGGTASRLTRTTVNGRPTIFLDNDGTNNAWMTSPVPLPSTLTVVQVLTPLAYSGPTAPFLWSWNTGGTGGRTAGLRCNSSNSINPYITWVGDNGNSLPITTGTSYVHFVEFTNSGANVRQSLNGTTPTAGTLTAYNVTPSVFLLGGDGPTTPTIYSRMYMSELIMFSNVLTTSQRQQLETYLADKWGLRASMGGTPHPFRFAPAVVLPTSIPGCALWLDATDSTSMTLSGSNLSQWRDKSSNGFAGTAVSSPTLQANSINGLSAVQFNGSSQYITFGNVLNLGTSPISVFAVTRFTGNAGIVGKVSSRWFSGRWGLYRFASDGGLVWYADASPSGANIVYADTKIADTTTTTQLLQGSWDRSTLSLTQNGTQRASNTFVNTSNLSNTDTLLVGGYGNGDGTGVRSDFFLNGVIGEILVYLGALTVSQRQQIEGYLAHKWGLQTNLPGSTAPFATIRRALTPAFVPTQIPGCALWLDAVDRTTLTLSGSNVTTWADKSGNGRNAVGTTSNPTYNATGFNSRPTVTFSNNLLTSSNWSLAPNRQFAWFVVVHLTSLANVWQRILISASAGYGEGYLGTHSNTSNIMGIAGSLTVTAPIATGTSNPQLVTYLFGTSELSSNTSAVSVNGGTFSTLTGNTGTIGTNGVIIGTDTGMGMGERFLGHLSEVICYNSNVTQSQRRRIEGYLAHKWGLLGTLGGTLHPHSLDPPVFLPTQIPGCVFWIDAADSTSMTLSGSNVTQWRDKSSNGHIGTAVASPVLTTVDGVPAVTFNGSSQYIDFGTAGDLGSNQFHMFAVSKFNTTADGSIFARLANGDQYYRYTMLRTGGVMYLATQADTGSYGASVPVPDTTTTRRLLNYSWDRSAITGFQNGTPAGSVSYARTATYTSSFKLLVAAYNNSTGGTPPSAGFYMNGSINEILFYFGPLSTAQRQQVEGYLAWKWNLQASLPTSTHPYRTFKP
jgi:hypothetical protein